MRVQFVARHVSHGTGTGRYASGLPPKLGELGIDVTLTAPRLPPTVGRLARIGRRMGLDIATFLGSYPLGYEVADADIAHVASQTMATLLLRRNRDLPTVVTALDIIPLLVADDPELRAFGHPIDALFFHLAMIGLRRADRIVSISHHTRQTLIDVLHIPGDRIDVTHLGVDPAVFRPGKAAPRADFGLPAEVPIAVYVGSNDPRKDLATLVRAIATEIGRGLGIHAVVVGPRQFVAHDRSLLQLIDRLEVSDRVTFIEGLPDQKMVGLLNGATCFVTPSLYEGFGLPALEAMACGTPVIYADATASTEVIGDAGLAFSPRDARSLATAMATVVDDNSLRTSMRENGLVRAATFTWERTAETTAAAYGRALGGATGPPGIAPGGKTVIQNRSVR